MVRFSIECTLPFSPEDFWRIRDAPSFIRFIIADGMLKKMTVTAPVEQPDGSMTRTQYYCPARVDCPDVVRAIVGDTMFDVVDEQSWDATHRPHHLRFTIKPSFLAALSSTHGELSLEPAPPDDRDTDTDDTDEGGDAAHGAAADADDAAARSDDAQSRRPQARPRPRHRPRASANARAQAPDDEDDANDADADTGSSVSDAPRSSQAGDSAEEEDDDDAADGASDASGAIGEHKHHSHGVEDNEHATLLISALPARDKARHVVKGVTRVRILTVGWFVERAIVHNLRKFYEDYPATILRFRNWLYDRYAGGDRSVPVALVIDRFLDAEAAAVAAERAAEGGPCDDDDDDDDKAAARVDAAADDLADGRPCESGDMSSVTTVTADSPHSDSSDGLSSD